MSDCHVRILRKKSVIIWMNKDEVFTPLLNADYAPVICSPGPLGAGDTGDIAGLKCRNLTSDVSRQCRGCAGVLISR